MTGKLIVDNFVKAVEERPEDFLEGFHTLHDKKTGIDYWIGNWYPFYGVFRPMDYKFSLWQQYRFVRAWKRLQVNRTLAAQTNGG